MKEATEMALQSTRLDSAIIIVDDTEAIALCVKTFLALEGFDTVQVFNCPQKALDGMREGKCPAFIITDYEMPVMTGAALLDSVVRLYPQANGVIITGHSAVPPDVAARYTVIRKDDPDFFGLLLRHVREELAL
jgi:FixJ family two-component response regulator